MQQINHSYPTMLSTAERHQSFYQLTKRGAAHSQQNSADSANEALLHPLPSWICPQLQHQRQHWHPQGGLALCCGLKLCKSGTGICCFSLHPYTCHGITQHPQLISALQYEPSRVISFL